MNLVLLKNISLVGIHWGAYTCAFSPCLHTVYSDIFLKPIVKEPGHIPSVWKGLMEYVVMLLLLSIQVDSSLTGCLSRGVSNQSYFQRSTRWRS